MATAAVGLGQTAAICYASSQILKDGCDVVWKKALAWLFVLFLVSCLLGAIWAQRGLVRMYGGHTTAVEDAPFRSAQGSYVFQNVAVLSPDGRKFIPEQFVLIEGGLIRSIDSMEPQASGLLRVDGKGKYLVPGLTDAHVHMFKSANDVLIYTANGVTQVRELAGEQRHLRWREAIRSGGVGPQLYVASPRTGSFGLLGGWFMGWSQGFDNLSGAEDAEKALSAYSRQGYDAIKVYSYLDKATFEAVSELAPEYDLDVVGHVPWSVELADIWRSNMSDIAHLEEIMNALKREFGGYNADDAQLFLEYVEERSKEIVSDLLDNDISVTTTLWLVESFVRQKFELDEVLKEVALEYQNPGIAEWAAFVPQGLGWLPQVNRYKLPPDLTREQRARQRVYWTTYAEACRVILGNMVDGGVVLMAGTDANLPPAVPGFSLHQELESLVNAGMSPAQAIHAATAAPAQRLGIGPGRLIEGAEASVVLLAKNPLEDIRNTRSIETVVQNGRLYDRSTLDKMLEAVREANDESRKVDISDYL